jgi:hypothetical protein
MLLLRRHHVSHQSSSDRLQTVFPYPFNKILLSVSYTEIITGMSFFTPDLAHLATYEHKWLDKLTFGEAKHFKVTFAGLTTNSEDMFQKLHDWRLGTDHSLESFSKLVESRIYYKLSIKTYKDMSSKKWYMVTHPDGYCSVHAEHAAEVLSCIEYNSRSQHMTTERLSVPREELKKRINVLKERVNNFLIQPQLPEHTINHCKLLLTRLDGMLSYADSRDYKEGKMLPSAYWLHDSDFPLISFGCSYKYSIWGALSSRDCWAELLSFSAFWDHTSNFTEDDIVEVLSGSYPKMEYSFRHFHPFYPVRKTMPKEGEESLDLLVFQEAKSKLLGCMWADVKQFFGVEAPRRCTYLTIYSSFQKHENFFLFIISSSYIRHILKRHSAYDNTSW